MRTIAPTLDVQSRTGLVYVDLDPSPNARAGMYVSGQIQAGQSTALLLPQTALVLRDGFSYVMQVDEQNRVKQSIVQLGQRQGEAIEIISGLSKSARVVASGAAFLNDGDSVRVTAGLAPTHPSAPAAPSPSSAAAQ